MIGVLTFRVIRVGVVGVLTGWDWDGVLGDSVRVRVHSGFVLCQCRFGGWMLSRQWSGRGWWQGGVGLWPGVGGRLQFLGCRGSVLGSYYIGVFLFSDCVHAFLVCFAYEGGYRFVA